jgi:hypothetical protein
LDVAYQRDTHNQLIFAQLSFLLYKRMASLAHLSNQEHDTLGVSVHHLEHVFLKQVCAATDANGKSQSRSSKIYEIENLQGPNGVIQNKGVNVFCPLDGKEGAAYVHCLQGNDHVGGATHMLSYSWGYSIGDIIDTLNDFCRTHKLDPKRTYIWICCLCINEHRVVAQSAINQIDFFAILGKRVKELAMCWP